MPASCHCGKKYFDEKLSSRVRLARIAKWWFFLQKSKAPLGGYRAFEWLNTVLQERDSSIIALRTDFSLDSIRPDPRYAEVVRKIGLPQ
jgi:hypothetical protein